ncbi:MAG: hypothetical protein ABSG62_14140 [Terracidiphilus sp.]|jgi:hypothetical protein
MKLDGRQQAALVLALFLVVISGAELHETFSAINYWRHVSHAGSNEFVVPHWWTGYTIISALFAPSWLACTCAALALCRRWPLFGVITLGAFLILEPISCASAPAADRDSQGFLGLEELPFADAERTADGRHLERIDQILKRRGDSTGSFPTTDEALRVAVGDLAFETSPYEQGGKKLPFELRLVLNQGVPYSATPEKPGIVYYAVNESGRQFVLTMSGLNTPISNRASMMKASTFVGEKQPWGGLLASEESMY